MRKKPPVFFALLLSLFFLSAVGKCYAQELAEVSLPAGRMRLPAAMRIVEIDIPSILDRLNEFYYQSKEPGRRMLDVLAQDERYREILELFLTLDSQSVRSTLSAVNLYLVNMPDGGNNYTAWFFTMKSNEETAKFLPSLFKGKMTEQKKEEALSWYEKQKREMQDKFPSGEKIDFKGPVIKVPYADLLNYKLFYQFEWQQMDFFEIGKKPAFSAGIRVNGLNNGAFSAFYGKQYWFGLGKKPALLAVLTFDSERSFWTQVFDKIMADGFKPASR